MAGHSKWANIRHRKAAQDAKRGKAFSKLIRELTVAAKQGGSVDDNPRLRAAVDKALAANMKRDTIDKAILRGSGAGEGDDYEELTYEGYGPAGVAILLECMTDNRNRTVSEVRHAFSKRGGNLGTDGSVAYLFNRTGRLSYTPKVDEEGLMEAALDAGAEDIVENEDGSFDVLTSFESYYSVKDQLIASHFTPEQAEITMIPSTEVAVSGEEAAKVLALVDMLEDLDDVQNVHTNADFSEEFLRSLGD